MKAYLVICRDDRKDDGSPGDYVLATRRPFPDPESAKAYADGISDSREPMVVGCARGLPQEYRLGGNDCQWPGCKDDAAQAAHFYKPWHDDDDPDLPEGLGRYCATHAREVVDLCGREYRSRCPSCACIHGVG